jgi:hypothetical protein
MGFSGARDRARFQGTHSTMKQPHSPQVHARAGLVASACGIALFCATAPASAQLARTPWPDPTPAAPPASPADALPDFSVQDVAAAPFDRVLFDEPGDGALWVRGASYKASFSAAGASVIPYFGADAPRNYPLDLAVRSATLGGEPLDVELDTVSRKNDVVRLERGAFTEEYAVELDRFEQRFVFETLPGAGELVLRMDARTELAAADLGATLSFENELGRVDYGQAFALDANGARVELDSVLVDGAIELRVPADFVANAALPLVIDPFVTFFTVGGGARHEFLCDVAFDVSSDRWCVSWADVWSATDYDVYARLVSGAGTLQATYTIDFTSLLWTTPAVANNGASNLFLVVAAAVPSSGVADIRGRTLDPVALVTGAQFQISPADGAYRNAPDVGGDPYLGSSYFCVVWQRSVSASNVDIEFGMVDQTGVAQGGFTALENGAGFHELPRISNGLGVDNGDGTAAWSVVWQHRYSSSDRDIYGAQVSWGGSIQTPMFAIEASTWDESNPSVSTMLDPESPSAQRPYMVVYERDYGSDTDILARVLRKSTLVTQLNLVGQFPQSAWYRNQNNPAVESDGEQFLVGFDERDAPGGSNTVPDVWMSSYFLSNSVLYPCELRLNFAGSPTVEGEIALASMAASGGATKRYFGTWVYLSINNGYDVQGGLWNGCAGGLVESFCAGDGTGAACPCSNTGAAGRGCRNSTNASGGLLAASGNASVSADTFRLDALGLPLNGSCLFFQGTSASSALPFGDGLRCVSGLTLRLPIKPVTGGGAAYPQSGETPISDFLQSLGAGDTRYYQAWYRDSASFCTGSTFNLTNALKVIWAP